MNNRSPFTGACNLFVVMFILFVSCLSLFAQDFQTPLQITDYSKLTSYDELSAYLETA